LGNVRVKPKFTVSPGTSSGPWTFS